MNKERNVKACINHIKDSLDYFVTSHKAPDYAYLDEITRIHVHRKHLGYLPGKQVLSGDFHDGTPFDGKFLVEYDPDYEHVLDTIKDIAQGYGYQLDARTYLEADIARKEWIEHSRPDPFC